MEENKENIFYELPDTISFISTENFNGNEDLIDALVKREAKLIKEHFTADEIANLILQELDGESTSDCIYGKMVGSCNSPRVFRFIADNLTILIDNGIQERTNTTIDVERRSNMYFVTPLEDYIIPLKHEYGKGEDGKHSDEYYKRIAKVVNWIKE